MTPSSRTTSLGKTPAPPLIKYRVYFNTWTCFARYIEAESESDAIDLASELLEREGTAAFTAINSGTEDFDVDQSSDPRLN